MATQSPRIGPDGRAYTAATLPGFDSLLNDFPADRYAVVTPEDASENLDPEQGYTGQFPQSSTMKGNYMSNINWIQVGAGVALGAVAGWLGRGVYEKRHDADKPQPVEANT